MANGFETIGWILTAKDLATKPMRVASDYMKKQADKTSELFTKMSNQLTKEYGERGSIGKAMTFTKRAFVNVFGSAITEPMHKVADTAVAMADAVSGAWKAAAKQVRKVKESLGEERTFAELFMGGAKAVIYLGKVGYRAFHKLTTSTRSLVVSLSDALGKIDAMDLVVRGIQKLGGIGGALLGPFGPLLNLFMPFINLFTKQFTPAIETFFAIVETAFAPFAATLEIVARNLALQIVPYLKPLATFLELAAVQIGTLVVELLKGKPDKIMGAMFKAFRDIGPILGDVLNTLLEMADTIIPMLMSSFLELAPVAIRILGKVMKVVNTGLKMATKLFQRMIPIATKVLHLVGTFIGDNIGVLNDLLQDVVPDLIDAFGDLFVALLPVLYPLTKLISTIVKELLAPAVKGMAKGASKWIKGTLVPFIDKNMPMMIKFLRSMTNMVEVAGEFFNKHGLTETLRKFRTLFIDPIVLYVQESIDKIFNMEVIRKIVGRVMTAIKEYLPEAVTATKSAYKKGGMSGVLQGAMGVEVTERKTKGLWGQIKEDINMFSGFKVFGQAKGGIVKPITGGVPSLIGEGGDTEVVMPLTAAGITAVLPPMLKATIPEMAEAVSVLRDMRDMMRGYRSQPQSTAQPNDDHLSMSVGMAGAGGGF